MSDKAGLQGNNMEEILEIVWHLIPNKTIFVQLNLPLAFPQKNLAPPNHRLDDPSLCISHILPYFT